MRFKSWKTIRADAKARICKRCCSGWGILVATLLLCGGLGRQLLAGEQSASQAPSELNGAGPNQRNSWGTIVVIGASASAGFTESEPLGGPKTPQLRLSRYLDAALVAPHKPVLNFANTLFFMQPLVTGRNQVQQALASQPGLVIGLDFLFWFCYGEGTGAERLERFEQGLKLLETLPCPIVVGDIPDASGASNKMLSPEQIPSASTLTAANSRLKEWAAKQPHVTVVPLAAFMRNASSGKPVVVHGITVSDGKSRVLQEDNLHPNRLGAAVLALATFDAFFSSHKAHKASEVLWDPQAVLLAAGKL